MFCESVGLTEGYSAGRGIQPEELQRILTIAMEVGKEVVDAADAEVERISK